jgi:DNA polymerase-3 subunit beta
MKVICGKDELVRGTQIVQTVVSPRSTLPILANFLVETDGSRLKLSSTDLEVGVSCYIKAEIAQEGSITIPAKRFSDIIRELPSDKDIEIRADESNQISIKCGKSHFMLMGLPKADYPVLPEFPEQDNFAVDHGTLRTMMRRTAFAVSTDETRYVLNGVYFVVDKGLLRLVSTDGRRLAMISRGGIDQKIARAAIVPTKAVNEVQRVLSGDEKADKVQIGITENQIAFRVGDVTILSRLIEGTFPNYEQVIPKKHESQIKLKVKEVLSAVKQMSLLTSDKASTVKFTFGKNTLRISASAQGLGSGESEIDIEHDGQGMDIAFNPAFLIDILKNVDEEEVNFELTNSLNPALIRPVSDKEYFCVVMPMRF